VTFSLFDVIRLEVDLPKEGLTKGEEGTIVHEFFVPTVAYEVEFVSPEPGELLTLALLPEQMSLVWKYHESRSDAYDAGL
jgi:hypothetical protein